MSKTKKSQVKQLTVPCGFQPRDYQLPLFQGLDSGKRRAFLVWPRQIGKDTSCWAFMCKEAAKVAGNYFYVFPTKEDARRALWEKTVDGGSKLLSYLPEELLVRKSNMEMVLELNNNSTIRIVGLDKNPEAIRGITPQGVVFSEFAFSDPDAYKALIPALRREGSWIVINSTPNGRNHFYDMYEGVKKNADWVVSNYQALWPDKPNYIHVEGPDYFDQLVSEGIMTWEDIEREYGCSFATGMKGSYYIDQIEQAKKDERIGDFPHDGYMSVDTFWDLGVDDSTAVWFRQVKQDKIKFINYYENSGKDLRHYVSMLAETGYRYRTHFLPHDADHRNVQTGKTSADIFQDLLDAYQVSGEVEVLKKCPVQDGINAVRSRFSRYCFDENNCHLGLKHIEGYHRKWDRHRKVFIQQPVHDSSSHAADALRMEGIADDEGNWKANIGNIKVNTGGLDIWDL